MSDSLWDGRKFRTLNKIDYFNRKILAIYIDTLIPASRVIGVLECLKERHELPEIIRVDNGTKFISTKLDLWSQDNGIKLLFIGPRKPTVKAFLERFNLSFRQELLNAFVFRDLNEMRLRLQE